MAQCTLPILYLNLGGEMMYIINQRLVAQSTQPSKVHKVMCDLVEQMLDEKCLLELFKYQPLYSKKSLRHIFDKLAQSTIMKLNSDSMDKLYDLMLMAVKYQVVLSRSPEEILLSTLVHLDSIKALVGGSAEHKELVSVTQKKLNEFFSSLTAGQYWHLRQRLLFFFQGMNKRVSIFLRLKAQLSNGRFMIPPIRPVSPHCEVPGSVRYYKEGSLHLTCKFIPPLIYLPPQPLGSPETGADRGTVLGQNLYTGTSEMQMSPTSSADEESTGTSREPDSSAELTLLAQLVGTSRRNVGPYVKLFLFDNEEDEEEMAGVDNKGKKPAGGSSGKKPGRFEQAVHVTKTGDKELSKLMADFNVENHDSGVTDDLLGLLDMTK